MSEIAKAYDPKQVESKWYKAWLENGCFKGEASPGKQSYCIMIPPPNVTGVLTMGHVLNNTIQDILVRRARQAGKSVLWQPGTDHAGIATQTRVEKKLRKEGKTRHDLGREKFLEVAREWRDAHGGLIFHQLERLGASCDWERAVHTLDDDYSDAVLQAFVKLYERGYIYRGKRMVNWCPESLTALSDEEVIMKPQSGVLYKMRYEIVEQPGQYIEISTTRPETLMGDTAVAVNPDDERYTSLIGSHVWRPFPREKLPIIGDEAVEKDFGTGVLKVTPAHDPLDFEIGVRHSLPMIDIMNPDGTLNELAGEDFLGIDRFKARNIAVEKLKDMGLLVDTEPYENNVGFSERADVPIEPRLSEQWFLKYPKVEEAKKVIRDGFIRFWPKHWEKTYLHWLENVQDWCISRQLWWGHRIPVWYKKGEDRKEPANWNVSVEGPSDPENWEQDEDVLDTWASSWLWPFATLGWPHEEAMKERDFSTFYPTSDLVTGPDILFFWVARMIMAGLEFMGPEKKTLEDQDFAGRIPFSNVYFTGIVRDLQGRKMSKSLGNSPDPIDLIEQYGADGLRFGIMSIAPKGQDVHFSEERIQQGRNFCNKLWNACRFRQMSGVEADNTSIDVIIKRMHFDCFDANDHAILGRLAEMLDVVKKDFDKFEFNAVSQHIYALFWGDFCDWYLEVSKSKLKDESLVENCLAIQDLMIRQILLLLHPFIPFITEELWHQLGYGREGEFIQNVDPSDGVMLLEKLQAQGLSISEQAVAEIADIREFVSKARALKAEFQLASKRDLTFFYMAEDNAHACIERHRDKILPMMGAQVLKRKEEVVDIPAIVTPLGTLYLNLAESIDIDAQRQRLSKELEKLKKLVHIGASKLKNERFMSKAPPQVVEGAKKQLAETQAKFEEVKRLLSSL